MGGQRNPLFDDMAPRTASPAAGHAAATFAVHPTASQDQGVPSQTGRASSGAAIEGLPMASEAACAPSMSNSSCSGAVLTGDGIADPCSCMSARNAIRMSSHRTALPKELKGPRCLLECMVSQHSFSMALSKDNSPRLFVWSILRHRNFADSTCQGTGILMANRPGVPLDAPSSHLLYIAGLRPLSVEVDYDGGSGPQSAHSMASGLSRSGSFAPSTLSVLYENQAMKVEREELKSELKLISARVWIQASYTSCIVARVCRK